MTGVKRSEVFLLSGVLVLAVLVTLGLSGCGGAPATSTPAPAPATSAPAPAPAPKPTAQPTTFKIAMSHPPDHYRVQTLKFFMDLVEKRTNGRVKWDFYHSETLHTAAQALEAVSTGISDVDYLVSGYFAGKLPEMGIFDVPWSINSGKWIQIAEDSRSVIDEMYAPLNMKLIYANRPGHKLHASRTKFIKTMEDFKGLKMRSGGGFEDKAYVQWGAAVISVPVTEQYSALQKGVADATSGTYDTYGSLRLYEVTPFITQDLMTANFLSIVINLNAWNKLTPADQNVLIETGKEAEQYSNDLEFKIDPQKLVEYKAKNGAQVYDMPASEISRLSKSIEAFWNEAAAKGPRAAKLVEICKKYR